MISGSIFFSQIFRLERARFCSGTVGSVGSCDPLHFPLSQTETRVQHPTITSLSSPLLIILKKPEIRLVRSPPRRSWH